MKKLFTLVIFSVVLFLNSNFSFGQLFNQDFSSSTTVSTYVNLGSPNNGQFDAISTSGAGTVLSINTTGSNKLRFARTANAGAYSRITDFSPTPSSLIYKFDITVSGNSVAQTTAAVFQVGSGFGTTNSGEANSAVHTRIGVNWTATGGQFSLRDLGASTNTANYSGTQTVTWIMNNSGGTLTYTAPDATTQSVGDDKWDLWIGTTQEMDEKAATTTTQTLTDLKFAFTGGTGTIDIDNINIDPIPVPCATPTSPATSINFSSTTSVSTNVNWTNGNGTSRIVVAKLGSAVTWTPTDNTTYTANASFGSGTDVSGSGEYVVYNGSSNTVPVSNLTVSNTYYFKVYEYNCSAGSEKYYLTSPPSNSVLTPASIAAPTFTTPICVSYGGATLLVSFTSIGTFTGNTYTVEMSDGAGSFGSYTTIGTISSNSNSITNLSCTIPYGTVGGASGNNYLLRVRASSPSTLGATSTALAVNTIAISPLTTQNFSPGAGGGGISLTASGTTGTPTKSWAYATVSGGPYTAFGSAGINFTPSFAACGTYYVVCQATSYSCGTTTSDEVQCNVTMPAVTSPTVTNACITDETVNWTLPAGYSTSNNTILVFAKAGSAVTAGTPTNAIGTYTANTTFGSGTPYQNDASAFCVYNGTSNTVNVSGLTATTTYHYLILNVQNSPTVYASGVTANATTLTTPPNITGLGATTNNGEISLSWTNPSFCYDEIMVVATDGGAVTAVPSGNGTQYYDYSYYGDPSSNVNLPSSPNIEYDIYQGTGTAIIISGLTNSINYSIKVFVRKGTVWSSGVTINSTPTTAAGNYQSTASGNWDDATTWLYFNGTSWVPASTFPNSTGFCQVTINSGHTVTVNNSNRACSGLLVSNGGKLYSNLTPSNSNNKFLNIYGNIQCDGTIGNGATEDALGFNIEGSSCLIQGAGSFGANRIRKNDDLATTTTTLTINMDVLLYWKNTSLYNARANTTFNVTINANKTVSTIAGYGSVSIDGTSGNGSGLMKGLFIIRGTFNINGTLYLKTDNGIGSGVEFRITTTGVVNVDSVEAGSSSAGGHLLTIQNGGRLAVNDGAGFNNFSLTNNTYNCVAGSTIEYSGAVAQAVESGINYSNLKFSGSGNKTANGNLTVNGNFTVDAAICEFNTSVKTLNLGGNLVLQNGGTMSDNCKSFLDITTNSVSSAQSFTGNSQIIKCLNLTSVKTSGSLSFTGAAGNTDLYIKNDLKIDHSGTAIFTDNGNTFNIGDDAEIGGASSTSSNFNLTGTLKFFCFYSSTDIHISDYAGAGVTKAHIGNLTIEPLTSSPINTVQFYPTGGAQTVYIGGNLIILNTNGTGTILNPNSNTISIKGNWSNYLQSGFTEGSGKVIFAGTAAAQSIISSEIFNELEINNSNGVNLNYSNSVSSQLILTNGLINTGIYELGITNNSVSSVSGYSSSSWVNGNLRRAVALTGTYDFPVGDAANFQLATVKINSSTGMSSILAFFNNTITGTAPSYPTTSINGDGIYGLLNSGFWTITPQVAATVNYDITLNQSGYTNFSGNANQLGIIKRPNSGANWLGTTIAGAYGFHSNATQSIGATAIAKRSGVTSFSDFAIGMSGNPLPVTLSSFTLSVKENKIVELNWKTEAEINCDYFSVERSEDGINFNSIGIVEGHKTSDQPHNYQLTDYKPFCSVSYYRLRQVDVNAEEQFSNKLSTSISCNGISIYPNPVLEILTLKYLTNKSETLNVTLTNIEGKIVLESKISFTDSGLELNVASLPAGFYFIHLKGESINYNDRFLKQ